MPFDDPLLLLALPMTIMMAILCIPPVVFGVVLLLLENRLRAQARRAGAPLLLDRAGLRPDPAWEASAHARLAAEAACASRRGHRLHRLGRIAEIAGNGPLRVAP